MFSPIEEIKEKLDIAQVVGEYIKLQKAGANLRALCPFHQEKNPSFFVSPARQMWHCFGGCGEGGDIFKFVMKIEGIEFGDALRLLAQKAGVELKALDPAAVRMQSERKSMAEMMEWCAKFFEKQLADSPSGKEATQYLLGRGVTKESIAKWRLGYAPDSALGLCEFLESKGYSRNEIGRAGMLAYSEGKTYDRFRSRIMFPVADLHGSVIGFGGRIFTKEGTTAKEGFAKYINTPNTALYDKSKVLYGLDKAKMQVIKNEECILVEGYMDCIMVSQAGNENVVAVSGTALTPWHLKVLRRYTENLLLSFDMDIAGDTATRRGIDLALQDGFSLKVITMPEKDPAEVIQESAEAWKRFLEGAVSILDFYFSTALSRYDKKSPEGKKLIAKDLLPVIAKIANKIEQAHWVGKLSHEIGIKEEVIQEELRRVRGGAEQYGGPKDTPQKSEPPASRKQLLEDRTLALLFRRPENLALITEERLSLFSVRTQEIFAGFEKNPTLKFEAFEPLFSPETIEFLKYIALKSEIEEEDADWEKECLACLQELYSLFIKEKLDSIAKEIQDAEERKDVARLDALLQQFQEASRKMTL
ncbi:MAG: DNA primase [Candidatus Wildermuthbacteria bacterium]|nr:DNA primase [Candidatus Wildermuthbacteria bacterium]